MHSSMDFFAQPLSASRSKIAFVSYSLKDSGTVIKIEGIFKPE